MKKILFMIFILFICSKVFADTEITFKWDKNLESDLAGYRLYKTQTSSIYTTGKGKEVIEVPAGVETATITIPDGQWYFVLTAFDLSGNESGLSKEVSYLADTTAPGVPRGMTITITININQ